MVPSGRAAPSVDGMETALITGASRGLGLALARELARRGWRLVIDARGADALEAARAELAERTEVVAIAGDVADAEHRRALVEAAGAADRPARQQRERARPEPAAGARRLPARRARARLPRQRARPAGAVPARAARACAAGARVRQRDLRRGGRAVRGLGRLRLVEGRARAAHARSSAPSTPTCGSSPSIRATCARSMHQEAFPGEDISDRPLPEASVPGLLADRSGDTPSGRYRPRAR